jgi:preprotein translocase subunit SecA
LVRVTEPGELERWAPLLGRVNDLGPDMGCWTDAELRALRHGLGERLSGGADAGQAMAEGFAAVREAARRTAGHRYRDCDVLAGAELYSGQAVDIDDDGFNHLIALLPAYICAASGESVHYVTNSSALAQRHFRDVEGLSSLLGLGIRLLSGTAGPAQDEDSASAADVTYGGYREFGYGYLGDHLQPEPPEGGNRKHRMAIVDQIDSILVDQASLPLVIRAPGSQDAEFHHKVAAAAGQLAPGADYEINGKTGSVTLTSNGLVEAAALLRVNTVEGLPGALLRRHLDDALRAKEWYRRGPDYQVSGGHVVINGNPGSRLAQVARLNEGVRQAVEAKEGLATSAGQAVWARITVRDYFRTYPRLSGISGVAGRAGPELERMYGLRTAGVPSGRPRTRFDHPDLSFDDADARLKALVQEAAERHQRGQSVLIGVLTAEDGQVIDRMLDQRKIQHGTVLPGDDEIAAGEAAAVAMGRAGQPGAVTIVTAAASRGCDIILNGGAIPPDVSATGSPDVSEPGSPAGLAVLVAGRSRSGRSDSWLRGLAGRRGEPGESRFFLSLQDPLLRGLQSRAWGKVPARIRRRADGAPLTSAQEHLIDGMQRKAEQADFERLLGQQAIEDVESAQRADLYSWREELLWAGDLRNHVGALMDEVVELFISRFTDPEQLLNALARLYSTRLTVADLAEEREERVKADAHAAYDRHEQFIGQAAMRAAERRIISSLLSSNWSRQLSVLEAMRAATGSGLSPDDWLCAYSAEAGQRYTAMVQRIKKDIIGYVMHSEPDTQ